MPLSCSSGTRTTSVAVGLVASAAGRTRGALSGVRIIRTPGTCCAAARSKPAIVPLGIVLCTVVAIGNDDDRRRNQRKLEFGAVADLLVMRALAGAGRRQQDRGDQLAGRDYGLPLRRVAGLPIEIVDRHRAGAAGAAQFDRRIE